MAGIEVMNGEGGRKGKKESAVVDEQRTKLRVTGGSRCRYPIANVGSFAQLKSRLLFFCPVGPNSKKVHFWKFDSLGRFRLGWLKAGETIWGG